MPRDEYQLRLLDEFRQLAVKIGGQAFDLRLCSSEIPIRFGPNGRGGWALAPSPEEAADAPRLDAGERLVVGHLQVLPKNAGEKIDLAVTIPRQSAAEVVVIQQVGEYWKGVSLGNRFHGLAAEASAVIPLRLRDKLIDYVPPSNTGLANWWYAFLFAAPMIAELPGVGGLVVHEHELIISAPIFRSADLLQAGLNSAEPVSLRAPEATMEARRPVIGQDAVEHHPAQHGVGLDPVQPATVPGDVARLLEARKQKIQTAMAMIDADSMMRRIVLHVGGRPPGTRPEADAIATALHACNSGDFRGKLSNLRKHGVFEPGKGYSLTDIGTAVYDALKRSEKIRTKSS